MIPLTLQLAPIPQAGYEFIPFLHGNQVHICGGTQSSSYTPINECYRYDAAADNWNLFTSIPIYGNRQVCFGVTKFTSRMFGANRAT